MNTRTISKRLALIPTCLALGWMSAALAAPKVYVANETDGTVSVIATDTRQTVRTIESVAQDSASEPVRDALARCGGVQCGYCTSGMVMSMSWLHQQQPRPTATEAEALMCGNLCRCTGYSGIRRAVRELLPAHES